MELEYLWEYINRYNSYLMLTSLAPRMMVVICDLSPHSARNVREKACRKMGDNRGPKHRSLLLSGGVEVRPCSASMEPVVSLGVSGEGRRKGRKNRVIKGFQSKDSTITDTAVCTDHAKIVKQQSRQI